MEILELLDPVRHDEPKPDAYKHYFMELANKIAREILLNTNFVDTWIERLGNEFH